MVDAFFLEDPKGSPEKCLRRGSRKGEKLEKKAVVSSHYGYETITNYNRAFLKHLLAIQITKNFSLVCMSYIK